MKQKRETVVDVGACETVGLPFELRSPLCSANLWMFDGALCAMCEVKAAAPALSGTVFSVSLRGPVN